MDKNDITNTIEFSSLGYPENTRSRVLIGDEERDYEFLGLLELSKGLATPFTLARREHLDMLSDVQCVEYLNAYSDKFWRYKKEKTYFPDAELASYPNVMELILNNEEVFKSLKGNELLTNTIIRRSEGKAFMGFEPLITKGSVIISENEVELKEDVEGFTEGYFDKNYWNMCRFHGRVEGMIAKKPVHFHVPKDNLEKTIPRVFLAEDESIHVFSDSPLNRESYNTKFPIVRRLK
jgi:hypothetical protein